MSNLYDYLKQCQEKIGTIEITQDFINYREEKKKIYPANGRDDTTHRRHLDCLIGEYTLIQRGYVIGLPLDIKMPDYIVEGKHFGSDTNALVDNKFLSRSYFEVPDIKKYEWYIKSINKKELTDFAFYKIKAPYGRPMEVGDTVDLKLCDVVDAKHVMRNLSPSKKEDGSWYIYIKNA
jgi:hypothetical protein